MGAKHLVPGRTTRSRFQRARPGCGGNDGTISSRPALHLRTRTPSTAIAGWKNEGGARADRRVNSKRKNCSRRIEENHEVALGGFMDLVLYCVGTGFYLRRCTYSQSGATGLLHKSLSTSHRPNKSLSVVSATRQKRVMPRHRWKGRQTILGMASGMHAPASDASHCLALSALPQIGKR
jgi:hypothetical protein